MFSKKLFNTLNVSVFFLTLIFMPFSYAQELQNEDTSSIEQVLRTMENFMNEYSSSGPVDEDVILEDRQKEFRAQFYAAGDLILIFPDALRQAYMQKLDVLLFKATSISQVSTEGWRNDSFPLFEEGYFISHMIITYPNTGDSMMHAIYLVKLVGEEIASGVTTVTKIRAQHCQEDLEYLKEHHQGLFEEVKILHNTNMRKGGAEFSEFILED